MEQRTLSLRAFKSPLSLSLPLSLLYSFTWWLKNKNLPLLRESSFSNFALFGNFYFEKHWFLAGERSSSKKKVKTWLPTKKITSHFNLFSLFLVKKTSLYSLTPEGASKKVQFSMRKSTSSTVRTLYRTDRQGINLAYTTLAGSTKKNPFSWPRGVFQLFFRSGKKEGGGKEIWKLSRMFIFCLV